MENPLFSEIIQQAELIKWMNQGVSPFGGFVARFQPILSGRAPMGKLATRWLVMFEIGISIVFFWLKNNNEIPSREAGTFLENWFI